MAYVVDTTQQLTITLLVEGVGTIVSFTSDKATAHEGETVNLSFILRNDGQGSDDIFGRITDAETGEVIMDYQTWALAPGATGSGSVVIIMPNKNLSLLLEAGHVE